MHPLSRSKLVVEREGELSEWSKEPHSKCGIRITSYRGFESLTLRKVNEKDVHKRASFFIYSDMRAFCTPDREFSAAALCRLFPPEIFEGVYLVHNAEDQSAFRLANKNRDDFYRFL